MKKSFLQSNPIPSYIEVSGEICVTYQGQVIPCKYCGDASRMQSECHNRATDFPALSLSKPCQSSTVLLKRLYILNKLTCQKKRKVSQSELDKTDSVSTTTSIKTRKQLNNTSNQLETDLVENQSEAIDNIQFNNDLHLHAEISPAT